MKHLFLAIIVALTLSISVGAQSKNEQHAGMKKSAMELKKELRHWFEQSVYPTITQWHNDYDASLSAEDLGTLNRLRSEARTMKQQGMKELRSSMREEGLTDRKAMKEKVDEIKEANRDEFKALVEQLKPIAKNSRKKLFEIYSDGEDQIEKWREEAKAIIDAWKQKNEVSRRHKERGGMHGMGAEFMPFVSNGKSAAMRFMLWDGELPPDSDAGLSPFNNVPDFADQAGPSVAPNPTMTNARVSMDDVANGPATIEIFSMSGNKVKSVTTTVSGSSFSETIDISGLPAGTYMVSVNSESGRRTSQLVVDK